MKINRVYIKNFGGLTDKEYILSDGLNVIFGKNESGKSTFLSFMRFMFYGAKKSRTKELSFREKYMPWSGGNMSGEVEFTLNGTSYSLSRTISSIGRKQETVLINKTTGEIADISNSNEVGTELFKLSEQSFLNTLFISAEGTKIDSDGELLAKISNVSQSGDEGVSYQIILDKLNNLIADISSPRRSKAQIPVLEKSIAELKEKYDNAIETANLKKHAQKSLNDVNIKLDALNNEKNELTSLLEHSKKYSDYLLYEQSLTKLNSLKSDYEVLIENNDFDDSIFGDIEKITPEEEMILLEDNAVQIATDNAQEMILKDKLKTCKTMKTAFLILSLISLAGAFFLPLTLIAAASFAFLYIHFTKETKNINRELSSIKEKHEKFEKERENILQKYNLESIEHFKAIKKAINEENARAELKNSKLKMAQKLYEDKKAEHESLCNGLLQKYASLNDLKCEKVDENENELQQKLAHINDNILRFSEERAKIKSNMEVSENIEQDIITLRQSIADNELLLESANEKLKVLNLAKEILDQSYEELKSNFAPKLAKATVEIFNSLTNGKYGELIVNDAFEILIKKDGEYKDCAFFSSGTIQQLYFALRLGIIELIMDDSLLFIDDAFITYDDERFEKTSEFLLKYSEKNQIIFCTCHLRESNMNGAKVLNF